MCVAEDDAGRWNKWCNFVTEHVYCTETRPYNQGARLTAYELVHDKIPATLVCDSMVSALMRARNITAVVVGADRVATNGDTANKIGTYQVLCWSHDSSNGCWWEIYLSIKLEDMLW